ATGDESVMPGLRRIALESARGQSIVGSWGHRFAGPDGRLQGYGMMNSPGIPLTIGLILARRAGVDDPVVEIAITKSARLIRFYVGKGAVPYGDHHPWIQTHEDNGKCGMAAVMFNLLGDKEAAEFFSWMSLASHGAERDCGHTGNFFNILWAMPGVALCGPHATGAWMQEFGAWYFDLARRWDGTFCHQGPPQTTNDKYAGWDCTGVYLLAYAMPLKKLFLTGKQPSIVGELSSDQAWSIIRDGRGWTNKDRNSFYDALSEEELLQRLKSWSPVVRERAAMALARRLKSPPESVLQMLESSRLEARYGACQALAHFKEAAAPAVPQLMKLLDHEDLWLRIKAAEALVAIGPPAKPALPLLLERLSRGPSKEDPRGMEQRYLSYALFDTPRRLLGNSLEGLDREAFYNAVRAGLRNEDGRARTIISSIYTALSEEDIRPILPHIYRSIVEPAPSGIMFADGSRLAGLRVLAKYHVAEGM
ncbi:MAG: HEAT repeat domain-containing protein, partial [Synergistales bacterium]|nr:HEAT repeat domain-containing protein [Synergistales bacterium]